MAVIHYAKRPRCHGKGSRDDGSACDLCEGLGEIPVHDTPDEDKPKE